MALSEQEFRAGLYINPKGKLKYVKPLQVDSINGKPGWRKATDADVKRISGEQKAAKAEAAKAEAAKKAAKPAA